MFCLLFPGKISRIRFSEILFRVIRVRIFRDLTVVQMDDPAGITAGQIRVVCYHDDQMIFCNLLQKLHHLFTRFTVQRTGRFISKQYRRPIHKCTGDGNTLHLSA